MKIENLATFPMQLDDDRIIGAAGTKEAVRKYDGEQLGKQDAARVRAGLLRVNEEAVPTAPKADEKTTNTKENK